MKELLSFFVLLVCCLCINATVQTGEFSSELDHFRPQFHNPTTFQYEFNTDYYEPGGPLFFYINDFGEYTNQWLTQGLIHDLARELSGALLTTDLRFFRLNLPTPNATFDNLQFLTLEQSFVDLAAFIIDAKIHLNVLPTSKVFLWGSGFGGTLAALTRQKFPHLVDGIWSSDGIFEPIVFPESNYEILSSNIYRYGGGICGDRTIAVFQEIQRLLDTLNDTILVQELSICRPFDINDHMDIGLFSEGIVQKLIDYFDREHLAGYQRYCRALGAIPNDPFRSFSRWLRFEYEADFGRCFNFNYAGRRTWVSDNDWHNPGTATGLRQMAYFQCTQIGQLRITTEDGMFGNHITEQYRYESCVDAFGPEYSFDALERTILNVRNIHGGRNLVVTAAIFTNGLLNTWYGHGITYFYQPNTFIFNIPGYGKSADFLSLGASDTAAMASTKNSVRDIFYEWVADTTNVSN